MDIYEIESIEDVPSNLRHLVPAPAERQAVGVGSIVRLCVLVNGAGFIAPWVEIVGRNPQGQFIGEVGGIMNSPDWYEYGHHVEFGVENIIGI